MKKTTACRFGSTSATTGTGGLSLPELFLFLVGLFLTSVFCRVFLLVPCLLSREAWFSLALFFYALERLCTDWCDSNLREAYLSTLPFYIRLAMFDGFSVYWTAYDCARRTKALRMRTRASEAVSVT
jgi:hypothetical protein